MHEGFVTARLPVEPVTSTDLPSLLVLWSDTRVAKALGPPKAERVQRALDEAIGTGRHMASGWILRRNGTTIGTIKLAHCHVLGRAEVELGYTRSREGDGAIRRNSHSRVLSADSGERLAIDYEQPA
jgi:hypothetical protein